jgi:hypothetical protein
MSCTSGSMFEKQRQHHAARLSALTGCRAAPRCGNSTLLLTGAVPARILRALLGLVRERGAANSNQLRG